MSGQGDVLAVLDADIRHTRQRLARARKRADDAAARKGERCYGADQHCDWVEHVLEHKVAARDAVADLVALRDRVAGLNPDAGEVGPGMLRQLVDEARRIGGTP